VLGAALAAGLVVAHLVNPLQDRWLPKCPFHELTGLWCPACGGTRSVAALSHGDVLGALRHNLLVLPVLLAVAWVWLSTVSRSFAPSLADRSWAANPLTWVRTRGWWAVVAVVAAFWIVRNVPGAPVQLLSR
jgi:hypothetical protein